MSRKVVVAGHLCLDVLPDLRYLAPQALLAAGKLFEVGALAFATGGAVSNTGLALDRLGIDVELMAQIGDDLTGDIIRSIIRRANPRLIETIGIHPATSSSYTIVLAPRDQDRSFLHYPGNNATFDAAAIDLARVAQADLFHLGYPPLLPALVAQDGAELVMIYQQIKALGVVTSLDTAQPDPTGFSRDVVWRTLWERTLPYVDICLPSIDEIIYMLRRADYERWQGQCTPHITRAYLRALARDLIEMGVAVAGFKLGVQGVYLQVTADPARLAALRRLPLELDKWLGQELWYPAFAVTVVGTTGAGDCCYAGFIAALLHGLAPADALQMANAVGACNVEAADALSGVRTWEATRARIAAGWQTHTHRLPD